MYGTDGNWIRTNIYNKFTANADWKDVKFIFTLKNFKTKKLGSIRIVLGAEKNSSISFANLKAEKETGGISAPAATVKNSEKPNTIKSSAIVKKATNLTLPKTFYGVPGIETAIYFDNIILTQAPNLYRLKVKPNLGKTTATRWIITPTEQQQGEHLLNISVISQTTKKSIANGNITLNIAPANAGDGKKITLLVIGDSLTSATQYVRETARLLSQKSNPEWVMLGTQKKGEGVAHEGYGGWTWKSFSSKFVKNSVHYTKKGSSPFIFPGSDGKPQLDVNRYFKEKCNGVKPNVITLLLGINDCFGLARKLDNPKAVNQGIDKVFANSAILIKALQKAAPNAVIGICLTPPPNNREKVFLANYKGLYSRWGWKQVQHILIQRQMKYFGNRQKDNIYIIPTELNIDVVDGYPRRNGVHPNKTGYNQLAATIYCWLKWQLYTNNLLK